MKPKGIQLTITTLWHLIENNLAAPATESATTIPKRMYRHQWWQIAVSPTSQSALSKLRWSFDPLTQRLSARIDKLKSAYACLLHSAATLLLVLKLAWPSACLWSALALLPSMLCVHTCHAQSLAATNCVTEELSWLKVESLFCLVQLLDGQSYW